MRAKAAPNLVTTVQNGYRCRAYRVTETPLRHAPHRRHQRHTISHISERANH
jgi:hypothetical protein